MENISWSKVQLIAKTVHAFTHFDCFRNRIAKDAKLCSYNYSEAPVSDFSNKGNLWYVSWLSEYD